jgi:glycerate kinase
MGVSPMDSGSRASQSQMLMKIVVAIDSFKGSLTAVQACETVAQVIRSEVPGAQVVTKPMADGGEGTASVLMAAAGGQWISRTVMGPLPDMEVEAGFVWLSGLEDAGQKAARAAPPNLFDGVASNGVDRGEGVPPLRREAILASLRQRAMHPGPEVQGQDALATRDKGKMPSPRTDGQTSLPVSPVSDAEGATAMIEMATAAGLQLLRPEQRNPLKTTTYGVGQLIKAATEYGARRILLAIGGSATVDGGVGAAMALGWRFLAEGGQEIGLGGGQLSRVAKIVAPDWAAGRPCTIEVLCDVDNPLCGEHGAARVYGPQKGATPEMVETLDAALAHLAKVVKDQLGRDIAEVPGAGAAGGLAAGAIAFMNARLVCGIDTVMAQTRLQQAVAGADWVITGEGSFDEQSLRGKVVSGVLRVATAAGAKVGVLAGQVHLSPGQYRRAGIKAAVSCMEDGMDLEYAIAHGQMLLDRAARRFAREHLFT